MFLAAFAEADIVGTCDKLDDSAAPVWSKVHLANAEALGCGTIACEHEGRIVPHIHTTLDLKEHSATGYTSHLLAAPVQFPVEMTVVEVTAPTMPRPPDPSLYDVPLLTFGNRGSGRPGGRSDARFSRSPASSGLAVGGPRLRGLCHLHRPGARAGLGDLFP